MDKAYRKLRAKLHKRREAETETVGGGFILRVLVCLVVFLCLAMFLFSGGEKYAWLSSRLAYYMQGAPSVTEAYAESVEAFNQFCDRIVEGQISND